MKRKITAKMAALLLATAMFASGCGSKTAGTTDTEETPAAAEEQETKTPEAEPEENEEQIVLAGFRDPGRGTEDPYYTNVNLYVWEPLIGESDDGEAEPRLATSWEMSEDAKEWTFHLREGVVFSDGYPFNADAVLLNFDRYKKLGVATSTFFAFDVDALYPGLQAVEKVDEYTVKLSFENPVPTLPYTIINFGCGMFSPNCWDDETGQFTGYCIGTGPFVITDHVTDEYITLERNDLYYGEPAGAKSIKIRIIPDHETRIAALRSGEIMGVYDNNAILPQSAKELESTGEFTASATASANTLFLNVNNQSKPFDDVRMRQALSLIIDRETLLNSVYCGYGDVTTNVLSTLSVFYKDITPEYNPEKAKELAAEVLQGETPTVSLLTDSTYKTDAELISSWLQELGLNVEIQILESTALTEAIKARDYDLTIRMKGMNNADPETMLKGYLSKDGFMNSVETGLIRNGYYSEKAEELLAQLAETYTTEERTALYDQLQDLAAEELPVVPLINLTTLVVHSNKVTGYDAMFTGITLPEVRWAD